MIQVGAESKTIPDQLLVILGANEALGETTPCSWNPWATAPLIVQELGLPSTWAVVAEDEVKFIMLAPRHPSYYFRNYYDTIPTIFLTHFESFLRLLRI